ncbi:A24 family peptidase [Citrobacter portucalensis]|uniref:prepilin peptidase n=1 Tax=Citrobacter TaxID=544 RepID=UPI00257681CC|nr:A24 family peptidase [Citrobacter sp. Cpo090]MDM2845453.1 A24 family peptidase [Citrobacter sp. Cpo090]
MLFDVFQQYPAVMPILATVGGLIIGSFLNVVIWRYPIMLRQQMAEFQDETPNTQPKTSLVLPRSHCPHCKQTIRVRDNIPILSWLILKGRCRDCQAKISKRYPLVELLTALVFLLTSQVCSDSGWALAVMILSAWLIAASIIDLDHQWLPDIFTQGVLWTGLIAAWGQQSPLTLQEAVTGVLVGFVTFYSLRWLAGLILRKEALGMGDVLLFAALGGWVGALSLPNVALIASCSGLIYAVITKKGSTELPFGPCLSLGGIATIYLQEML